MTAMLPGKANEMDETVFKTLFDGEPKAVYQKPNRHWQVERIINEIIEQLDRYGPNKLPINEHIRIAKKGYRYAQKFDQNWAEGVNNCPYGPGIPGNDRANAWYDGWWFWFYVVKRWKEVK